MTIIVNAAVRLSVHNEKLCTEGNIVENLILPNPCSLVGI